MKHILTIIILAALLTSPVSAADIGDYAYGDIRGDGEVMVGDAIIVLQHVVEMYDIRDVFGEQAYARAKVSGEAELSINDAILICRYIVELIDTFPVEEG